MGYIKVFLYARIEEALPNIVFSSFFLLKHSWVVGAATQALYSKSTLTKEILDYHKNKFSLLLNAIEMTKLTFKMTMGISTLL